MNVADATTTVADKHAEITCSGRTVTLTYTPASSTSSMVEAVRSAFGLSTTAALRFRTAAGDPVELTALLPAGCALRAEADTTWWRLAAVALT